MSSPPHTPRPPTIGLAGGIGSGKSAVAGILRELGCVVADSDAAGRAALHDPPVRDQLLRWWGSDVLDESGAIDRGAVARIVFADERQRRRLEALTHPWIEARRRELFDAAPAGTRALVIDAALLFEAGLDRICDAVIFVDADRAERLRRVEIGRGWDEQELRRREDSQMPLDEKRSKADYVIENTGDLVQLAEQVSRILIEIMQSRGEGAGGSPPRSSDSIGRGPDRR